MGRLFAVIALIAGVCAGAPALAEPPPVEAYGKLPALDLVTLSPSGDRYAFVATSGETRRLVATTADGKTVLVGGDIGTNKVLRMEWIGEDHLLVSVSHSAHPGVSSNNLYLPLAVEELPSFLLINIKTGTSFVPLKGVHGVYPLASGPFGEAQIDGRWYVYFAAITEDSASSGADVSGYHLMRDLYRVDVDTGAAVLAAHGYEDLTDWLVGPQGDVVARSSRKESTGDWTVENGKYAGQVLASGHSNFSGVSVLPGRGPDTVLVELPIDSGQSFQEVSLSGEASKAGPVITDADGILIDPLTHLWIGTLKQTDRLTPTFFSPTLDARARGMLKAFPNLSVALVSYTPDLSRMIAKTSGEGDAGTYWLVDIASGSANIIGEAYPDVPDAAVGPIKMVDWKAADGLQLHGVLNLPPGRDPRNLPVIVMPHGGPEARDYPEFWWWSQMFASRGYAVFQPNFRGSSGYGAAFRDAGFGQFGRKMETDITDGLSALAAQGIVDPKRACIAGWSYGGYAALAGVTVQHGFYRCAVSMAGLSDLSAMLAFTRTSRSHEASDYWRKYMGVTSFRDAGLDDISPAKLAAGADAPILMIHGRDDSVVPIDQSREMEAALKTAGKPVEFVELPNADHWLLHEDTRLAMARASLAFVLKYDPPEP